MSNFLQKSWPLAVIVAIHLLGAATSFVAAVLYSMAGEEWQTSFYSMVTCLWVMTLGFRLIERFQNRSR